jgi:hypothetical protein
VIVGCTNYASYKDMHPLKDVIKDEEDEEFPPESIEERQIYKSIVSEVETSLSHKSMKGKIMHVQRIQVLKTMNI